MTRDALSTIDKVIDYTISHPDDRDQWEKAPALTALITWGRSDAMATARRWIDRAVVTQSTAGELNGGERFDLPAGHTRTFTPTPAISASLGYAMLRLYQKEGGDGYLEAATRHIEAIKAAPRTRSGGVWSRAEGPELWIDFTYLMCPFLALYGIISGQREHLDEAFRQYRLHVERLVDPIDHLARHAWCETPNHYPQSTYWARGNGWLVACSTELIAMAPDHPEADYVRSVATRVLQAMRAYQDRSGLLRHILDDPHARFEASSTVMYAYALAEAVRLGLLEEESIADAQRAFRAVDATVTDDGAVPNVAVPPGGPGVPFGSTAFGQGFYLLAAHSLRGQLGIPIEE